MSKLYGTIDGAAKTQATRRGHNRLTTHAASWSGAIRVDLRIDADGVEHFEVTRVPWRGRGNTETLASGTLNR